MLLEALLTPVDVRPPPGLFGQATRGADAAARAVLRTKLFRNATSLGGTESLIEHRGPVEGPDSPTPQDLLRLSVGLESAEDLIADLEQALGQ